MRTYRPLLPLRLQTVRASFVKRSFGDRQCAHEKYHNIVIIRGDFECFGCRNKSVGTTPRKRRHHSRPPGARRFLTLYDRQHIITTANGYCDTAPRGGRCHLRCSRVLYCECTLSAENQRADSLLRAWRMSTDCAR
jgi:hypothetical protein